MYRTSICALTGLAAAVTVARAGGHQTKRKASHAQHGKSRFESPADAASMPAVRYGAMSPDECYAELDARQVPYAKEPPSRGVAAPVRLTGPLHGVTFKAEVEEKDRATTPYEVANCSLVLALDDFSQLLAAHQVVTVEHYSMWRPPSEPWPADQLGTRHAGAVAIDAARFFKSDGTKLSVLDDFHGAIGDPTCGPDAHPHQKSEKTTELREILCETVAQHLFNVVLTPNFNKPHKNHFHLEVTSGVQWFLVH